MSNTGIQINYVYYCRNKNVFIAIGDSGLILKSFDGRNWEGVTSNTIYNLYGVTYSESLNLFVIVGAYTILTSSDLDNWTTVTTPSSVGTLRSITFSERHNLFIAIGLRGSFWESSDGINWTTSSIFGSRNHYSVTYSNEYKIKMGSFS